MRLIAFAILTSFLALPALAQDEAEDDGFSLMERGAQLFFEGIMREMEPSLDDLRGLAENLEPGFESSCSKWARPWLSCSARLMT